MFELNSSDGLKLFKERLSNTRNEKGYTQETFAEKLYCDRTRVANWERPNSTTVMQLRDFCTVCDLLDVDPNYLLGVNDIPSIEEKHISDAINLSTTNINMMKNNFFIGKFFDSLLSSENFFNLINNIKRVTINGFFMESLENIFTPYALTQLFGAYDNFRSNVLPLDMNVETFIPYVEQVFPWKPEKQSFNELLHSIINNERYFEMLNTNPLFIKQTDFERYETFMYDVANSSYKHLNSKPIIELAEQYITKVLSEMVNKFVEDEIYKFKKQKQ